MSVDAWPRPPINNMSIPMMGDGSDVWCRKNEWSVSFPPFRASRAFEWVLMDRQNDTFIPLLSVTLLLSISISDFFPPN